MIKYIALASAFLLVTLSASYFTFTHKDRDEVVRLKAEHERLVAQNDKLSQRNDALKDQIIALRDDPRLAERRARALANLARPHELIFSFERPADQVELSVHLKADAEGIVLAGKAVELQSLPEALEQLHVRVPHAKLHVKLSPELDALTRQQIMDALSRSKLKRLGASKP